MCDEEQITTVEELSELISGELGLREQLDVIRIIYPEASIGPADTEFVIGKSGCLPTSPPNGFGLELRN